MSTSWWLGALKNDRQNYPRKCFWTKEKETRVKFNLGLALIGLRTTGPRTLVIGSYHWSDHWLLLHGTNWVHKNKSEPPFSESTEQQLFSHDNHTWPNQHRHTSIRTSTKAYWENYTSQFCKICNCQLLQAHQLHKQHKTKPPPTPPSLIDQIALIDNKNFPDHLNLNKPHKILPKATKASPTGPNLRNFSKNTPIFSFQPLRLH